MEQLQDCFATTDWSVFENKDLEQHTASVLGYITHCMDTVTRDKRIRVYPDRKPWMTKEVQCLLKDRDTAFKKGDQALYSTARANLKRGIRKAAYRAITPGKYGRGYSTSPTSDPTNPWLTVMPPRRRS